MSLLDFTSEGQTDTVHFRWHSGSTGRLELAWDDSGYVRRLTVTFD